VTPYDSARHLEDELDWIRLVLRRRWLAVAAEAPASGARDEYRGLYVSEEEVERILGPAPPAARAASDSAAQRELDERIARERAVIDARVEAASDDGAELRLPRLRAAFDLGEVESALLLVCLAAELDTDLQRVFAFLQDDVSLRRPSHGLLGALAQDALGGAQGRAPRRGGLRGSRAVLGAARALREHELTCYDDDPAAVAFARSTPRLAEVVMDFLLGVDRMSAEAGRVARLCAPEPLDFGTRYHARHRAVVEALLEGARTRGRLPRAYVEAPERSGVDRLVDTLAFVRGCPVVRVEAAELAEAPDATRVLRLLVRDARLHGAIVHVRGCEAVGSDAGDRPRVPAALRRLVRDTTELELVLTGTEPAEGASAMLGASVWTARIPHPDTAERVELWSALLCAGAPDAEALPWIERLATGFRLTPGQIEDAVSTAALQCAAAGAPTDSVSIDELLESCRQESRRGIRRFARCRRSSHGWDDLSLPSDVHAQLRELYGAIRSRRTVHETWGFERKLSLGKGVTALFAGPSGTGKTMSAEIIANELGLDLYKLDLSTVVDKYVGETERNLRRIFDAAANGVLFFDEADALFGKRSDVKDAHDRYANIEVNYLLQRLEETSGVVVLATNLMGNLDSAFLRRLQHVVEFPAPGPRERERIWRRIYPEAVPLDGSIDYEFLAQSLELSGGNIKNVALNSAYLAAESGRPVGMQHVVRAAGREYRKLGRICSRADFGPYASLVEAGAES